MDLRRVVGLIAWPLLWLVVAAALGWAVGGLVESQEDLGAPAPQETYASEPYTPEPGEVNPDGFGSTIFALPFALFPVVTDPIDVMLAWLVGVALGGLIWVVGLNWTANRLLPDGKRAAPVVLAMLVAFLGSLAGLSVLASAGHEERSLAAVLGVLAVAFGIALLVLPVWALLPQVRRAQAGTDAAVLDGAAAVDGAAASAGLSGGTEVLADWMTRR